MAATLAAGTDFIVGALTALGLEVSTSKSVVLGSGVRVARLVGGILRTKACRVAKQAKLLGTDAGGGRRRSVKALKGRLAAFRPVVVRIRALKRGGVQPKRVAAAVAPARLTY